MIVRLSVSPTQPSDEIAAPGRALGRSRANFLEDGDAAAQLAG